MASQSQTNDGIPNGSLKPPVTWGQYNEIVFIVQQALAKMQTATLVQIKACTNTDGLSPVGFVDVLPLVNQIDGQGDATPHETIYNIPYMRMQGGSNAVILDPKVGDIGICVFASRDISKVKATRAQANPGSYAEYSFSDGLYVGGVLNGAPTQYIQFTSTGINIVSPTTITLQSPQIVLNGNVTQTGGTGRTANFSGSIAVTGDVTANGTSLHTHEHGGVTTGSGNTGAPI